MRVEVHMSNRLSNTEPPPCITCDITVYHIYELCICLWESSLSWIALEPRTCRVQPYRKVRKLSVFIHVIHRKIQIGIQRPSDFLKYRLWSNFFIFKRYDIKIPELGHNSRFLAVLTKSLAGCNPTYRWLLYCSLNTAKKAELWPNSRFLRPDPVR